MDLGWGQHRLSSERREKLYAKDAKATFFEAPEWYRTQADSKTVGEPFLPEFDLWVSLWGGNGRWARQKAWDEWDQQVQDHKAWEADRQLEEERARAREAEAAQLRLREAEELRRWVEEAERERRRRREEEERQRWAREEEERLRRLEEERKWFLRQPRQCDLCGGSGLCTACKGDGCKATFYLTPTVTERTKTICGRLPRGCSACGGTGDDGTLGEFICGTGKCSQCEGEGRIQAPPGGWPVGASPASPRRLE